MGNSSSNSANIEHIANIETFKTKLELEHDAVSAKKRSIFFGGFPWKKIAENTRKTKNSKSQKIKPEYESEGNKLKKEQEAQNIFYITNKQNEKYDVIKDGNRKEKEVHHKQYKSELAPVNPQKDVSAPKATRPRKVVIQASTSELLRCLGEFVCDRCNEVEGLKTNDVVTWLRNVDRSLISQGWQELKFIMPSSVVFMYMLCRECVPKSAKTKYEVKCHVLTCLYVAYSYMGNEISYPLRPFLMETHDRYTFWERCCVIMAKMSGKMLRINSETHFFTSMFRELTLYSKSLPPPPNPKRTVS